MAFAGKHQRFEKSRILLRNGDCMPRAEFHSLYTQMPDGYRAELLGNMVFEPSPVSWWHSEHHAHLTYLLRSYCVRTPFVSVGDNGSLILGEEDEVQPDLMLRISPEAGGNSRLTADGFIEGAPELVAEVAFSSRAIDLHLKKERYTLAGVIEYMVVCLSPKKLYWFNLARNEQLKTDDGAIRSEVFPGLWIHIEGLLSLDNQLSIKMLNSGLKSKAHKSFAARLSGAK